MFDRTKQLPSAMIRYLRARGVLLAAAIALTADAALLLALRPFVIGHMSELIVFAPAVPLQCLLVVILAPSLSSRMETFEQNGVRKLWMLRCLNVALLTSVGLLGALLLGAGASWVFHIDTGTAGPFAAARAFLGLWGVTLVFAAFLDVRLAALIATPLALLPLAADTAKWAEFGRAIGFVLAPAESVVASWTAFIVWVIGGTLYVVAYTARNAPTADRQAILDARASPTRWHFRK